MSVATSPKGYNEKTFFPSISINNKIRLIYATAILFFVSVALTFIGTILYFHVSIVKEYIDKSIKWIHDAFNQKNSAIIGAVILGLAVLRQTYVFSYNSYNRLAKSIVLAETVENVDKELNKMQK